MFTVVRGGTWMLGGKCSAASRDGHLPSLLWHTTTQLGVLPFSEIASCELLPVIYESANLNRSLPVHLVMTRNPDNPKTQFQSELVVYINIRGIWPLSRRFPAKLDSLS